MTHKHKVKNREWESDYPAWCPTCNAPEMHPDGDKLLIRGYKVDVGRGWESQCLVCAGYYNDNLEIQDLKFQPETGWFL